MEFPLVDQNANLKRHDRKQRLRRYLGLWQVIFVPFKGIHLVCAKTEQGHRNSGIPGTGSSGGAIPIKCLLSGQLRQCSNGSKT